MRASDLRAALLGLFAMVGCNRACGTSDFIASLGKAEGEVSRDQKEAVGAWRAAVIGDRFGFGDGIRTATRSSAYVDFTAGGGLNIGDDTLVRFNSRPDTAEGVAIEFGDGVLEGLGVRFGVALVDPSSGLEVRRRGQGLELRVVYGRAIFEDRPGHTAALTDTFTGFGETKPTEILVRAEPPVVPKVPSGATLTAKGKVRIRPPGTKRWRELAAGTSTTSPGLQVEVKSGTAEIMRQGARALVIGPAALILGGATGPLLRMNAGKAEAIGEDAEAVLDIPGGSISAQPPQGRARVQVTSKGSRIEAEGGDVQVVGASGRETLHYGESAHLSKGGALAFDVDLPDRAQFSMVAGESPIVHDALAPTAIEIQFGTMCPSGGMVELASNGARARKIAARGKSSAVVPVPVGRHRYDLHCLSGTTVERSAKQAGRIIIKRDSGKKPLPREAPENLVEADGRNYTVLYQNRLPRLTMSWKSAPPAPGYMLNLVAKDRTWQRTVKFTEPHYRVRSGDLVEGLYDFWFEVAGEPARRSEPTHLKIDFDNAAAHAVIRMPPLRFKPVEGRIRVTGEAVEGAEVSIAGAPVVLDRHHRFDTEVSISPDRDGLAVRIQDRQGRIHYYVRRVQPGADG